MNHLQIQNIEHAMKEFSKKTEVKSDIDHVLNLHRDSIDKVYEWASPLELTSKLQQTQRDVNQRVLAIEQVLPCKADRSELHELEALATSMRRYDMFVHDIDAAVKALQLQTASHSSELLNHDSRLLQLDGDVARIQGKMTSLADNHDVQQLFRLVEQNARSLESCVHHDMLKEVSFMQLQLY